MELTYFPHLYTVKEPSSPCYWNLWQTLRWMLIVTREIGMAYAEFLVL